MSRVSSSDAATFFVERLCPEASNVYRLAFALSLSREGAERCVKRVYGHLLDRVDSLRGASTEKIRQLTTGLCWVEFRSAKEKIAAESSDLASFLAELPVAARAVLTAIDVLGLSEAESAKAFELSIDEVHAQLTLARKSLVNRFGTKLQSARQEEGEDGPEDA
jgi:hypothetical protein